MDKKQEKQTNNLKFGKRMYVSDIKEASNGSKFLKITESVFVKEGEPHRRNTMILFKDNLCEFIKKLEEIEAML